MSKKIEEIIKVSTSGLLERFYGDYNDIITRKTITSQVDDFLESLEINDYEIVCNDTNNPAKMIDENKLLLEIYIQYQNDEEYKKYRFEMSREGADFSELLDKTEEVNG
jgi:hypothetical protein